MGYTFHIKSFKLPNDNYPQGDDNKNFTLYKTEIEKYTTEIEYY